MIQYSRFGKVLFFAFTLMLAAPPAQAQLLSVNSQKIKKPSSAGTEQLREQEIEEPEKAGKRKVRNGAGVGESVQREAAIRPAPMPGPMYDITRVVKSDSPKQKGNGMRQVPIMIEWKSKVPQGIVVHKLFIELETMNTDGSTTRRREVLREASQPNATINTPMRTGVFAKKWTVNLTVEYGHMGKGNQRYFKMFTESGEFNDRFPDEKIIK